MRLPVTIVNFKTYEEATGQRAEALARALSSAAKEEKREVVLAAQAADIYRVAKTGAKVFAQHIDCAGCGKFTGAITAESVKAAGAAGTLINHSERRLGFEELKRTVEAAKRAGIISVVCIDTPEIAAEVSRLRPDFIAIEPPELIAGKVSVSEAKPWVITSTINKANKVPVLCGAGINKREDVETAYKLGAQGILVSSAIVKAENPKTALKNLLNGYK